MDGEIDIKLEKALAHTEALPDSHFGSVELEVESEAQPPTEQVVEPIKDESGTKEGPSLVDQAAYDYQQLLPKFREKLEPMSRRQQQRVISAVMEYPFETNAPRFSYPSEKELFHIAISIMDCQFVMKREVFNMMQDSGKMAKFKEEFAQLEQEQKNKELVK